jgi:rRNA maturation protein Nop10
MGAGLNLGKYCTECGGGNLVPLPPRLMVVPGYRLRV